MLYCISHGQRIDVELLGELLVNVKDGGCLSVVKFRSVQSNASSIGAEDALDEELWIALLRRPGSVCHVSRCSTDYVLVVMVTMARPVEVRRNLYVVSEKA